MNQLQIESQGIERQLTSAELEQMSGGHLTPPGDKTSGMIKIGMGYGGFAGSLAGGLPGMIVGAAIGGGLMKLIGEK